MASSKALSRLCSRLQPLAPKLTRKSSTSISLSPDIPFIKSISQSHASASARRTSLISRLPVELSSLETMMPLHSAIASARMNSSLSTESQSWCLVPQGISMPL